MQRGRFTLVGLQIVRRVGLGEQEHGLGAALIGQGQVALQACGIKVGVAGRDDEQRVDIGRRGLKRFAAFRASLHHRQAVETAMQGPGFGVNEDPIAHRDVARVGTDGQRQLDRAGLRQGGQARAVDRGDPHGGEIDLVGFALIFEEMGPTQTCKVDGLGGGRMIGHGPAHDTRSRAWPAISLMLRR